AVSTMRARAVSPPPKSSVAPTFSSMANLRRSRSQRAVCTASLVGGCSTPLNQLARVRFCGSRAARMSFPPCSASRHPIQRASVVLPPPPAPIRKRTLGRPDRSTACTVEAAAGSAGLRTGGSPTAISGSSFVTAPCRNSGTTSAFFAIILILGLLLPEGGRLAGESGQYLVHIPIRLWRRFRGRGGRRPRGGLISARLGGLEAGPGRFRGSRVWCGVQSGQGVLSAARGRH